MAKNNKEYEAELTELYLLSNILNYPDLYDRYKSFFNDKNLWLDRHHRLIEGIADHYIKFKALPSFELAKTYAKNLNIINDDKNVVDDFLYEYFKNKTYTNLIMSSVYNYDFGELKHKIKIAEQQLEAASKKYDIRSIDDDFDEIMADIDADKLPTGYKVIDDRLNGGLERGTLTFFAAPPGGGKSIGMQNLAINYAKAGQKVLYLSIELSKKLIYQRLAAIKTNTPTSELIANKNTFKNLDLTVEVLKFGSTVDDINNYINQYINVRGYTPDVLIIDYLDLLNDNTIDRSNKFDQHEQLSVKLRELAIDYNFVAITASQINRSGHGEDKFESKHIAGGISKINTADNLIGLKIDKIKGECELFFIKTRTSSGDDSVVLSYNTRSMLLTDTVELSTTDKLKKAIELRGGNVPVPSPAPPTTTPNINQIRATIAAKAINKKGRR